MPEGELLDRWHTYERRSADWAIQAAGWVSKFFDPASKLFRVSVEAGTIIDATSTVPNASTSLIGLTVQRCAKKTWSLNHSEWGLLKDKVTASKAALIGFSTVNILPLHSFGVLPLFSTSYLAEWLPLCLPPEQLSGSHAYVISLRRVIFELFDLTARNTAGPYRKSIHPFLLCNVLGALNALRSMLTSADPKTASDLSQALQNETVLAAALQPYDVNKIDRAEYDLAIGLGSRDFAKYLAENTLDEILKQLINFIEITADNDLLVEIANLNRPNGRGSDPATLAYAMKILAEVNPRTHMAVLLQGLGLLLKLVSQGSFLPGQPFHSDNKGRALFVPSIEVANIAISIALVFLKDLPMEQLTTIIDRTTEIQDVFLDQCNTIEAKVGTTPVEMRGWCSDRAPSPRRIDSWISVQVLEFFLNRLNLLRWTKRASVFSEYNVRLTADCRPKWDKVQDPDEGHFSKTAKQTIWNVVQSSPKQVAPVFLLYGPPGTSKTTLVNALAAERGWDLISLSPSDFVADSLDRIELRSRKIFKDLMMVDKCVILMDEMDSLFRDRKAFEQRPGTIIEYVIPALLPKLQELREYAMARDIAIFYITNYFEAIDSAISRGGRMDNRLLVLPYSKAARERLARDLHKDGNGTSASFNLLNQVLSEMPCNHVYRDIEGLVKLSLGGAAREQLIDAAEAAGIAPEVYDPKRRIEAFREYCYFMSRLTNQDIDDKSVSTKGGAQEFLKRCNNIIRTKDRFLGWSEHIRYWDEELAKHR